jgi:hypothetical protein
MNILIFGAGYSAKAFARERNPRVSIAGTTRSSAKFDTLRDAGISPLVFDGVATPELLQALADTTHLVISIAPDDGGDPVLGALANKIKAAMPKLRWIGYLSTVGVYGDYQGDWVSEADECRPVSRRSKSRGRSGAGLADIGRRYRQTARHLASLRHLRAGAQRFRQSGKRHREAVDQACAGVTTVFMRPTSPALCGASQAEIRAASSTSPTMNPRRRRMWSPMPRK